MKPKPKDVERLNPVVDFVIFKEKISVVSNGLMKIETIRYFGKIYIEINLELADISLCKLERGDETIGPIALLLMLHFS